MYFVALLIGRDTAISVSVPENKTFDVAGNPNFASNFLHLSHYSVPASSVALYTFTTAGLLATTLASGALSISSASLAAAGALDSRTMGSITTNPSRNLLGMASHLQTFALSSWLAVSLPVEYFETVKGLRWLLPHVNLPWEKKHIPAESDFVFDSKPPLILDIKDGKQRQLRQAMPSNLPLSENHRATGAEFEFSCYHKRKKQKILDHIWKYEWRRKSNLISVALPTFRNYQRTCIEADMTSIKSATSLIQNIKERKLGANASMFGPPLSASEYLRYFENQTSNLQQSLGDFSRSKNTGWKNFERNMFWLAVASGALIIGHILLLMFLRWRTKTSLRGSLSIPRFELFLLILALSCLCQASSFIIRGGTTAGIIVGVLLLAIPTAFFFSVFVFIFVAVIMGALVQYKEFRQGTRGSSWHGKLLVTLFGRQSVGKWVRKEGLTATFIPRFGLLFEDRKGPKKVLDVDGEFGQQAPRWVGNGSSGIGRMRPANSDDSEDASVSKSHKLLGTARVFYITVDVMRRITLGVVFGAYPRSDRSWSQVFIVFGMTVFQFLYLVFFKPYIRRGVQCAETVSLVCEAGIFASAIALLVHGEPSEDHKGVGILMLAFLMVSFVVQLANEWYALMEQLLRLSPSEEPSLKLGLKMFWRGLMLPFIPRRQWSKFITPQPQLPRTGLVHVVHLSPSPDLQKTRIQPTNSPATIGPTAVSVYDPGSPSLVDPRSAALSEKGGGEIRSAAIQRSGKQARSPWARSRSLEGKKSKAAKSDPRTSDLKLLRELAKASFPGIKRDISPADLGSSLENIPPVGSTGGADRGKQIILTQSLRELRFSDHSSDDSGEIVSDVPPSRVPTTRV
ncbi:hypothetical protein O6H91_23G029700 [Diphasiastrum complanatum]|nr:hypothetical protein O6H91_23G029700 [Diphasiastrum complanatum]